MTAAYYKPWWVWYKGGSGFFWFQTEEEAMDFQADPSGGPYLGDKFVMHVVFSPHQQLDDVWTNDGVVVVPGPETSVEAAQRMAFERLVDQLDKAADDPDKVRKVELECQPTPEDAVRAMQIVDERNAARQARAAKKAAKKGAGE